MRNNIVIFIVLFLIGLVLNYQNLEPTIEPNSGWETLNSSFLKEKKLIVSDGDVEADKKVVKYLLYTKGRDDASSIFYYAFLMAIQYEYTPANYDAYQALIKPYGEITALDKNTQQLAMFFLHRGANKGNRECMQALHKLTK